MVAFFCLMAGEIAAIENQPAVPGVPENSDVRRAELVALEKQLNAIEYLERYNGIIKVVDEGYRGTARFFLVQYDYELQEVTVKPQYFQGDFSERYRNAEGSRKTDSVLVGADGINDLREAFPNYFLDVQLFTSLLKARIQGEAMQSTARRFIRHPSSGYVNIDSVVQDWDRLRK